MGLAALVGTSVGPYGGVGALGAVGDSAGWLSGLLGALREGLRLLDGDRLDERLGLIGRAESALAAIRSEAVSAVAAGRGEAKAAEAVRDHLRESRGKATRDVKLAGRLGDLPRTVDALENGDITPKQAQMIADAAEDAPVSDQDEQELVDAAKEQTVDRFGRTVRDHVNERTADQDVEEKRRRQRARRGFSIRQQSDGMYRLGGLLDPLAGARVQDAIAAEYRRLFKAEDAKNRSTAAQLHADAFEALVTRRGGGKPAKASLVVVADYDVIDDRLGNPRLADGTRLTVDEFVKLALEAEILPALFDSKGQPLWLGRAKRDANTAQRTALAVRDGGCVGCAAPIPSCEPHHEHYWENGGPTDIDNLSLVCGFCHHKEIHSHRRATINRGPDGKRTMHHPGVPAKANGINQPLRC